MRAIAIAVTAMLVAGCNAAPVRSERSDNAEVQVDTLFTKNGCTVYRFVDAGHNHYFADCRGAVMSRVRSGKTTRDETVTSN